MFCLISLAPYCALKCIWSPRPTARVLSASSSRFWFESQDRWTVRPLDRPPSRMRAAMSQNFLRLQFPCSIFFNQKHIVIVINGVEEKWIVSRTQGANSVFRSGVNKAEQDLPVKQKRNTNEGSSSAVKYTNVVSKVAGLRKEARKHRNDWKPNDSEMPADFNVNSRTNG